MIQILGETKGNLICTKATEKLIRRDFEKLLPLLVNALKVYDKIRWYFEMENFKGCDLESFCKEVKLGVQHTNAFDKIAMVGEAKSQEWMADVMKLFTKAEIKFFKLNERGRAWNWIASD